MIDKNILINNNMKDKYWASNPNLSGSYVDKGRVEGRPAAPASLEYEMNTQKPKIKLTHVNSKSKFSDNGNS